MLLLVIVSTFDGHHVQLLTAFARKRKSWEIYYVYLGNTDLNKHRFTFQKQTMDLRPIFVTMALFVAVALCTDTPDIENESKFRIYFVFVMFYVVLVQ